MRDYLIDGQKLLWHQDRLAEWQKNRLVAPIYVEISPLSYCNHHCIFCGIDFAQQRGGKLDTATLCASLSEMGRLGVKSVMFAGEGEPLLHEGIGDFIGAARRAGIDAALTTNGSPGTSDLWRRLLPDLTWVKFSVDAGSPQVFSKVHGVSVHAFERVIRSIEAACEAKRAANLPVTLGVQFLLIEENLDDLEPAMELFSGLGVDYLVLKPYSLHPQMLHKKDLVYSLETIERIEALLEQRQGIGARIIFRKDAVLKYLRQEKGYRHCYALPFWGYISSQGSFYTCSVFMKQPEFLAGNIYQDSMPDILFGERRRASLRYGERDLDVCGECRINCRMARINEFLEMLADVPPHVNFI